MKKILVTGSNGLIGSEVTKFYLNLGYNVIGIDNNMREYFFGISNTIHNFINDEKYQDFNVDIRDYNSLSKIKVMDINEAPLRYLITHHLLHQLWIAGHLQALSHHFRILRLELWQGIFHVNHDFGKPQEKTTTASSIW